MVGEADRLHLIVGFGGRAAEGAGGNFRRLVHRVVLRNRLGRIDREEGRRTAIARRCRDRIRGDLAVDRSSGEIGVRLLVTDGVRGFGRRKLNDLDLARIHAILLQDHLEQIDIGLGAADDADTMSGELGDFRDLRRGLLALGLAGRRHPQHGDVLAQRCHGLGIPGYVEIASDNGEIGLALTEQRGTGQGAVGRHRAQPELTVLLVVQRLRQRLNHPQVVAVGRTDRDPQGHRPHRKVIAGDQRANDRQHTSQDDECRSSPHRAGRGRGYRFDRIGAVGHRSLNNRLRLKFVLPARLRRYCSKFLAEPRLHICVMVTGLAGRHWTRLAALFGHGPHRRHQVLG